jgi:hypothetical protein
MKPSFPKDQCRELRVDNNILLVDTKSPDDNRIFGVFGKGRDKDVPKVRSGSTSRNINLNPGEYIEDPSHFMIAEDGLVVIEKNPNGPALSSLGIYIQKKCSNIIKSAYLNPVPKGEFLERIKRIDFVKKITLRLGVRGLRLLKLKGKRNLFSGLEEAQKDVNFETVTIELSTKHKLGWLNLGWRKNLEDAVRNPATTGDIVRLEIKARMEDTGELEY